jgi:MbtH protein
MSWDENETAAIIYHVVVNHEEQYSIWPDYKKIPGGWRNAGKTGSKDV